MMSDLQAAEFFFLYVPFSLISIMIVVVDSWIRWDQTNELNMLKNQVVGAVFRTMGKKEPSWQKLSSARDYDKHGSRK